MIDTTIFLTREHFITECTIVAVEFNTQRIAEGSTVNLCTGFYREVGECAFNIFWDAIEDSFDQMERMHVCSAPAGSGKTSFGQIAAVALARSGGGALIVVNQIEKADKMFREIDALAPGIVAVWTGEHDTAQKVAKDKRKLKLGPAKMFTQNDLKRYPIAIVTHHMYVDVNGDKARLWGPNSEPRALTLIDERIDAVTIHTVTRAQVDAVQDGAATLSCSEEGIQALGLLWRFMRDRDATGPSLEKPALDEVGLFGDDDDTKLVTSLRWFKSPDAIDYVRAHLHDENVVEVFNFARCLADGYAFVTRSMGTVRYVGYETGLAVRPGMVMLDATADIDGYSALNLTWREMRPMPTADYGRLQVTSVPSIAGNKRLKSYLVNLKNIRAYTKWMMETIKAYMKTGEKGLIICRKDLLQHGHVLTEFDLDRRHLWATHWGDGIGYNSWADASVVFLFDEFFIPKGQVIATANGLREAKATKGPAGKMGDSIATRNDDVDALWAGHLLRWMKQMALRGAARCFGPDGVCGAQRLVFCGSRGGQDRLLSNFDKLFPGAPRPLLEQGAPATIPTPSTGTASTGLLQPWGSADSAVATGTRKPARSRCSKSSRSRGRLSARRSCA
jgi:hypothetical protein